MNDSKFPSTTFVMDAMIDYFIEAGFDCVRSAESDLEAISVDGDVRWVVEVANGSAAGVESLHHRLGHLITLMVEGAKTNYVLAIPAVPDLASRCNLVPYRVREALNLWWCVVGEDGSVVPAPPDRELTFHGSGDHATRESWLNGPARKI